MNEILRLQKGGQQITTDPKIGRTVLEHALQEKLDWGYWCQSGRCARCRSLVLEGQECLEEPNSIELKRLRPEEFAQGFRLGCQAKIKKQGKMNIHHQPYY